MGYETKNIKEISEDNLLNFHLSHRTDKNFLYEPNKSTKKIIWKYLSSNNLLQKTETIDLENIDKIKLIEKATHENNYDEKELFDLYKRFQFSIDQLINAEESYGLLPNHKGRALLYQKLLLSKNIDDQLNLLIKIKESFNEKCECCQKNQNYFKIKDAIEYKKECKQKMDCSLEQID